MPYRGSKASDLRAVFLIDVSNFIDGFIDEIFTSFLSTGSDNNLDLMLVSVSLITVDGVFCL